MTTESIVSVRSSGRILHLRHPQDLGAEMFAQVLRRSEIDAPAAISRPRAKKNLPEDLRARTRSPMRRREFITLLGSTAVGFPLAARAQQVGKIPRIGYLSPGSASPGPLAYHDEFQRGLRELGYVEGRNIVIEYRFADGKFERLAAGAAELVQLNVDVIVSVVTQASLAAKNATRTIPIVIVSVGDPVGAGLVASLARPGANVTGNSGMTTEVVGKSLGLFKQTVPKVKYCERPRWRPGHWVFNSKCSRREVPTSSTARSQRSPAQAPPRCWCWLIHYSQLTPRGSQISQTKAVCRRCMG